jgi:hypothetical protein
MPRRDDSDANWIGEFFNEDSPWGGVASAVMHGLHQATAPQRHIADQMMQFMGHLQRNVMPWFVNVIPDPCVMQGCEARAVVFCMACKKPVCLAHVHVSHRGEGVCDECVASLLPAEDRARRRQQAPPRATDDDKVRWAFRIFQLKHSATEREINLRFRKLAAENHPDRAKTEKQRKRLEEKMAKITEAYHVLKKYAQREAA